MNKTQLKLLKAVCKHDKVTRIEIMNVLDIGQTQFLVNVKELSNRNFIRKDHDYIHLADTFEARVLKKLSEQFDIEQLLLDSNELVLGYISDGVEVKDLFTQTKLGRATIYRALRTFEELGVIKRVIMVNTTAEIKMFAYNQEVTA